MLYNYDKLFGRMRERGCTQEALARRISMNASTLNLKFKGKSEFRQSEIHKLCAILEIDQSQIPIYFFCINTSDNQSYSGENINKSAS